MSLLHTSYSGAGEGAIVPDTDFSTSAISGTVYSGVKFDADGNMYRRQAGGGWSNAGAWRLNGAASSYYLSRVVESGTLTTDAGAGPLQMNTDRIYDIQLSTGTQKSAMVSYEISTDISGTPIISIGSHDYAIERGQL